MPQIGNKHYSYTLKGIAKYKADKKAAAGAAVNERTKDWLKGAVNPKHKGWCTPMTKPTCTGRRRAFAKTMKKHHGFHENTMNNIYERTFNLLEQDDKPSLMQRIGSGIRDRGPARGMAAQARRSRAYRGPEARPQSDTMRALGYARKGAGLAAGVVAGRAANAWKNMSTLDKAQTAGDVAGFTPYVGPAIDATNAVVSGGRSAWDLTKAAGNTFRGRWKKALGNLRSAGGHATNAALRAWAAVPGPGDATQAAAMTAKATRALGQSSRTVRAGGKGADLGMDTVRTVGRQGDTAATAVLPTSRTVPGVKDILGGTGRTPAGQTVKAGGTQAFDAGRRSGEAAPATTQHTTAAPAVPTTQDLAATNVATATGEGPNAPPEGQKPGKKPVKDRVSGDDDKKEEDDDKKETGDRGGQQIMPTHFRKRPSGGGDDEPKLPLQKRGAR